MHVSSYIIIIVIHEWRKFLADNNTMIHAAACIFACAQNVIPVTQKQYGKKESTSQYMRFERERVQIDQTCHA